jgi:alpha-L-arabinofuranosidase
MSANKIVVNLHEPIAIINPNIYGHFAEHLGACIYEGTFEAPDAVRPVLFTKEVCGRQWRRTFAPASVTVFRITL